MRADADPGVASAPTAYLLNDPKAPLPTIRQLAREGAVVDGGMRVSNPAVTWPNHTSLVTGVRPEKHGVLANGVLVRGAVGAPVIVDPKQDKAALVRVRTLYDAAHAAGLTTAEINWPCTRRAMSLHDSFPDVPDAVAHSMAFPDWQTAKVGSHHRPRQLASAWSDARFGGR